MTEKLKNHFISTTYQKQWYSTGNNNSDLFCSSYDNFRDCFLKFRKKNHGNNKSFQNALYWKDTKNHKYKTSLEDSLGEKESDVGKVFKKIRENGILNLSSLEKMQIVEFATSLVIRSPKIIKEIKSKNSVEKAENALKYHFLKSGGTFAEYYRASNNELIQDYIKNLNLEGIQSINLYSKNYHDFLLKKFNKPQVIFWDVSSSKYKLLTSNHPVIYGNNIFEGVGFDLIFPVSPTKLMLLVSEESLITFKASIQSLGTDGFVAAVNYGIISNHRGRDLNFDYEIYSATDNKNEILPDRMLSNLEGKINW